MYPQRILIPKLAKLGRLETQFARLQKNAVNVRDATYAEQNKEMIEEIVVISLARRIMSFQPVTFDSYNIE